MYSKDELLCINILESVNFIIEFTDNYMDVEEFAKDRKSFDATMMNFIVIGEMTTKLSDEFKDKYEDIEWQKMYGFRNVLAHDYFGIDITALWGIIKKYIPELKVQMEKILG